jgi:hypothetical protein
MKRRSIEKIINRGGARTRMAARRKRIIENERKKLSKMKK